MSRWDWWAFGSRYDGLVRGIKRDWPKDYVLGPADQRLENNCVPVRDLPDDFRCWAIVAPGGRWHEKAEVGWFGMTTHSDSEWDEKIRKLLVEHNTCLAVGCDLHI